MMSNTKDLTLAALNASIGLCNFRDGHRSVADEDRLLELIQSIPAGITVEASSTTSDCHSEPCSLSCRLKKIRENAWEVQEHWFAAESDTLNDNLVRQSMVIVLSGKRARVDCRG